VTVQFGLYDVVDGERRLCGVAVFGAPVSAAVLTKPLPELRPSVNRGWASTNSYRWRAVDPVRRISHPLFDALA
jgi:hypothetical protein